MAEAMCERSVTFPDAVFEEVRRHFDEKAIVELVAMIALENLRARFNRALEIPSDGLCQLPRIIRRCAVPPQDDESGVRGIGRRP